MRKNAIRHIDIDAKVRQAEQKALVAKAKAAKAKKEVENAAKAAVEPLKKLSRSKKSSISKFVSKAGQFLKRAFGISQKSIIANAASVIGSIATLGLIAYGIRRDILERERIRSLPAYRNMQLSHTREGLENEDNTRRILRNQWQAHARLNDPHLNEEERREARREINALQEERERLSALNSAIMAARDAEREAWRAGRNADEIRAAGEAARRESEQFDAEVAARRAARAAENARNLNAPETNSNINESGNRPRQLDLDSNYRVLKMKRFFIDRAVQKIENGAKKLSRSKSKATRVAAEKSKLAVKASENKSLSLKAKIAIIGSAIAAVTAAIFGIRHFKNRNIPVESGGEGSRFSSLDFDNNREAETLTNVRQSLSELMRGVEANARYGSLDVGEGNTSGATKNRNFSERSNRFSSIMPKNKSSRRANELMEQARMNNGLTSNNVFSERNNRFSSIMPKNKSSLRANELMERARMNNGLTGSNAFREVNNRYKMLEMDSRNRLIMHRLVDSVEGKINNSVQRLSRSKSKKVREAAAKTKKAVQAVKQSGISTKIKAALIGSALAAIAGAIFGIRKFRNGASSATPNSAPSTTPAAQESAPLTPQEVTQETASLLNAQEALESIDNTMSRLTGGRSFDEFMRDPNARLSFH